MKFLFVLFYVATHSQFIHVFLCLTEYHGSTMVATVELYDLGDGGRIVLPVGAHG